ncbi:MAG: Gfo/Idh/MocA family oxidoreductase [Cognatishimia sp.]|uniref:Gfo/Idh/MocA family oxidoreductase n=1 Tax=Cognatishimia sp. TaxID=2211648 RepID=UPI00405962DF
MNGLLIGYGNMGRNHARLLLQTEHDLSLVEPACADRDDLPETMKAIYDNLDTALVSDSYDFAVVAAPSSLHFEIAKRLIQEGIDLLVEKPLCDTLETAEELARIAKDKGVRILPGHVERYNPAVIHLKQQLQALDLSSVYRVEVVRCSPFSPRISDVGVAADLSVHDLDAINFLLGESATSVYCRRAQNIHATQEDGVLAILNYNGKFDCVMNTNWTTPLKRREMRVFGAWGMFSIDFIAQEVTFIENPSHEAGQSLTAIGAGDPVKLEVVKAEPLKNELDYFFAGLAEGRFFDEEVQSAINVIKVVGSFDASHSQGHDIALT